MAAFLRLLTVDYLDSTTSRRVFHPRAHVTKATAVSVFVHGKCRTALGLAVHNPLVNDLVTAHVRVLVKGQVSAASRVSGRSVVYDAVTAHLDVQVDTVGATAGGRTGRWLVVHNSVATHLRVPVNGYDAATVCIIAHPILDGTSTADLGALVNGMEAAAVRIDAVSEGPGCYDAVTAQLRILVHPCAVTTD